MSTAEDTPHVLYRFFSGTGQLLYVGITMSPPTRFKSHSKSKDWWRQVVGITVENYDNRADLLKAEKRAIKVECPLHNVVHNRGGALKVAAPRHSAPAPSATEGPQFVCEGCGSVIVAGERAYLHINRAAITQAQEDHRKYKAAMDARQEDGIYWITASDIPLVSRAEWHIHHGICDPDQDTDDYWVEISRVDTYAKLLKWTAHLLQKKWLRHTNWSEFLYVYTVPVDLAAA